jgi:hypothetical protein
MISHGLHKHFFVASTKLFREGICDFERCVFYASSVELILTINAGCSDTLFRDTTSLRRYYLGR